MGPSNLVTMFGVSGGRCSHTSRVGPAIGWHHGALAWDYATMKGKNEKLMSPSMNTAHALISKHSTDQEKPATPPFT